MPSKKDYDVMKKQVRLDHSLFSPKPSLLVHRFNRYCPCPIPRNQL